MTSETLKELGLMEERSVETSEVMALVGRADRDLGTGKLLADRDEEWAFAAAYQAMSRMARALLLAEGFRPKGGRSRDTQKLIVTAAGVILGPRHKSLINKFDRMRRKYQGFMEEAGRVISRYEANQGIKDAEEFLIIAGERIRDKYSQMSLLNHEISQVAS